MRTVRKYASTRYLAVLLPLCLILTACAAENIPSSSASLKVTILSDGENVDDEFHLKCQGETAAESSTLPEATEACALLNAKPQLLATKTPGDRVCTEIYGGPAKATITGELNGQKIDASFDRHDGCAIADWDAVQVLVGKGQQ